MNRTAWMSLAKTGLKEITHQIICIAQFHLYKVPKQKEIMWFRDANVGGKTIKNYFSKKNTGYWLPLARKAGDMSGRDTGSSPEWQPIFWFLSWVMDTPGFTLNYF